MTDDRYVLARVSLTPPEPREEPAARSGWSRPVSAAYIAALAAIVIVAVSFIAGRGPEPSPRTTTAAPSAHTGLEPVYVNASFPARTLAIQDQKARAPIDTVGVVDNEMGIPHDVRRVGVYDRGGPLDGTTGSVLIVGHVHYTGQGKGVLGDIDKLAKGSVLVTRGHAKPQAWRVTRITSYKKSLGLPREIFRHGGKRVLTVVTCGERDAQGRYLTNVVVRAVPVETIVRTEA